MAQYIAGTHTHTAVSVSNSTSTSVLAANAQRHGLILSNVGANNIYVRLDGGTASSTTGVLLAPNSAPLVLTTFCPVGAVTAIAATGATNLAVDEIT